MGVCQQREEITIKRNVEQTWYTNVANFTKEKYNSASEAIAQASVDYAPQLDKAKIQYDKARMYANGWTNESVTDSTDVAFITEFENELPLRNISLTEFERRLKKLVTPAMKDMVTVRVLEECFKDHWAFTEIIEAGSLTRELMFDEVFLDE